METVKEIDVKGRCLSHLKKLGNIKLINNKYYIIQRRTRRLRFPI
jgi:hypothetical protein